MDSIDFIPLNLSVDRPDIHRQGLTSELAVSGGRKRKLEADNLTHCGSALKHRQSSQPVPSPAVPNTTGCRHGNESTSCVPWQTCANIPCIIRLHNEIKHFYEAMCPTVAEQSARDAVLHRIKAVVRSLWTGARVEVFGSVKTGLYLPSSDIDLVVFGRWKSRPLYTLSEALIKEGVTTKEASRVIEKASVPIIKLTDTETNIKVDISFNMVNGHSAAHLIQGYILEFPAMPYLLLVLKQFLNQRDLNDVYTGGVGSYSLILLIVSFLQLHSRDEGRQGPSSDGTRDGCNYGVLLLEFFELYGIHFNYEWTGVSVRDRGRYVEKAKEKCGQMSLYIEDPSCPDNDVARGSYNVQQVQMAFAHAYRVLCYALTTAHGSSSSGDGKKAAEAVGMTTQQDLCDGSILSWIVHMPHQKHRVTRRHNSETSHFARGYDSTPRRKPDKGSHRGGQLARDNSSEWRHGGQNTSRFDHETPLLRHGKRSESVAAPQSTPRQKSKKNRRSTSDRRRARKANRLVQ